MLKLPLYKKAEFFQTDIKCFCLMFWKNNLNIFTELNLKFTEWCQNIFVQQYRFVLYNLPDFSFAMTIVRYFNIKIIVQLKKKQFEKLQIEDLIKKIFNC